MHARAKIDQPKPFADIAEATAAFATAEGFRHALVADFHAGGGRFDLLPTRELMEACGIEVGNIDEFCLSQVATDRRAYLAGHDVGWSFRYTYRIKGRSRKVVRFQSVHGPGGVMESCEGPYVLERRPRKG